MRRYLAVHGGANAMLHANVCCELGRLSDMRRAWRIISVSPSKSCEVRSLTPESYRIYGAIQLFWA